MILGGGLVARQGGKHNKYKHILERCPPVEYYNTYVEPFIGGGSVFLNVPIVKIMVGGDTDVKMINLWKDLQNVDIDKVKQYNFKITISKEQWDKYNEIAKNKLIGDATDRFIANLLIRQHSFSTTGLKYFKHNSISIKKASSTVVLKRNLEKYKEHVKNAKFFNKSYEYLINKYDSKTTFFYCDPPYYNVDSTSYETGEIDHVLFHNRITKIKGLFLISYNDDKYIKDLYKDYYITSFNSRQTMGISKKYVNEILISNYKVE
tara:strand:- start:464 stop:1252 length:789 start_codon:yes stop_codon:yes gene_type:complete